MNLTIRFIEIAYIVFMLGGYFKTHYSLLHPILLFNDLKNDYLNHSGIWKSTEVESKICIFGHWMAILLAIYLTLKYIFNTKKYINKKYLNKINTFIFRIGLVISLMNPNAFLYLLPIFVYELYL